MSVINEKIKQYIFLKAYPELSNNCIFLLNDAINIVQCEIFRLLIHRYSCMLGRISLFYISIDYSNSLSQLPQWWIAKSSPNHEDLLIMHSWRPFHGLIFYKTNFSLFSQGKKVFSTGHMYVLKRIDDKSHSINTNIIFSI